MYLFVLQGISPHISPFTDVRDLGNLLNRAGFTMLTIVSLLHSSLKFQNQLMMSLTVFLILLFWHRG